MWVNDDLHCGHVAPLSLQEAHRRMHVTDGEYDGEYGATIVKAGQHARNTWENKTIPQ